ncbi:MAG: hypothetical protein HQL82_03055 [Magnetococcales bacterium]|nr:hypothetical protein [Magnetococcales bacterium]
MDFTPRQVERYSRQILLREVGGVGQARLGRASILLVDGGAAGRTAGLYLAGAGVGRLTLADGREEFRQDLLRLNPEVAVQVQPDPGFKESWDLVLDCGNRLEEAKILARQAWSRGIPVIATGWGGVRSWMARAEPGGRCLDCLTQALPAEFRKNDLPDELGPLPSILGGVAAGEALRLLLGLPAPGSFLLLFEGAASVYHSPRVTAADGCPRCF